MKLQFPGRAGALACALVLSLAGCAGMQAAKAPIAITLVALNDLHGALEAGKYTYTSVKEGGPRETRAGGVAALSRTLAQWRLQDPELLLIGSGDLVGASPPLSAMWADEPTLLALDLLGLRVSSVGNHEFDWGKGELLRQQRGGCESPRPQACKLDGSYAGTKFSYLAANVIDTDTGKPLLPAYRIEEVRGVRIAFIGAVLKDTPDVVKASGVEGLRFEDEAETVNRLLPELKAQGATVFVVLVHQGGNTPERFDQQECRQLSGPVVDIAKRLDPQVKLVISGHTHQGYLCKVGATTVTQALTQGKLLSRVALSVDPVTRTLIDVKADNVVMHDAPGQPATPAVEALLARVRQRSAAVLAQPVARIAVPAVTRKQSPAGESALGDLVTDAQVAAASGQGAQIALLNYSTMRSDLASENGGLVTRGRSAAVLPFGNELVLMTLTGAQLRAVLEQQRWPDRSPEDDADMLDISHGFTYRWDAGRPPGQRVVPGSLALHGKPVEDAGRYRVVVNSFIAAGGDGYTVFKDGTERVDTGIGDIASFDAYLAAREKAGQPAGASVPAGRIVRIN